LSAVEELMDQQLRQILDGLEADARTVAQYEAELTGNLAKVKLQAQELAQNEIEYNRLNRGYDTNKNLYTMVMTRLKETSLTGQLETNNVRLLERAKVPSAPASPDIGFNVIMALVIGLGIGFGFAFLLTFFDDTIKGQEDVERGLGLAYLGIVPSVAPATAHQRTALARFQGWAKRQSIDIHRDLHVHNHPASAVAEYCRVIRSNLLFMSPDAPLRRIAVSSADPGAGKTATALNLGILMSQTQGSTLLVDADMRCAKLHKAFGLAQDVGLSTLIATGGNIEDAVRATEVPGLHVLPAGKTPPQPAELLHSKRFADLVEELQRRYKFIIFDTPPLMGLTDTMVLARHLEGVVLVARWRRTRRDLLRRAQQQLTDIGVKILGVVVNDVNLEDRAYYYYQYGRYQRYGSYSYAKSSS
jgi:polysaccharide biosynthesis transport protein